MKPAEALRGILNRIDGRGYKAYKDLQGSYDVEGVEIHVDHVQGDPFAAPSRIRVRLPRETAGCPPELFSNRVRRLALEDVLARRVREAAGPASRQGRGTGKSGLIAIDAGAQEVLERTAVVVEPDFVEARLQVGLPAAGRRVLARQAERMLLADLPAVARRGLVHRNLPAEEIRRFVECVENQEHIRSRLDALGLVAFVGDGAVLPRETGASDRPLPNDQAVAFRSPPSLRVEIPLPNPEPGPRGLSGAATGMGVPAGVTLIAGGGYHGKSTLLRALERGVYPHVPGDGRERVVTRKDVVKIRAEDGRRVERVDISPFVGALPHGRSTEAFRTDDASGSTSQAANIVEALEMGASGLLLDEDTSATSFMVRDARMQALVRKAFEPITPFLDRVRELWETQRVSTILVMGGCGDYLDVADTVLMMREYLPQDATREGRQVARDLPSARRPETPAPLPPPVPRIPDPSSFDPSRGRKRVKIDAKGLEAILYGRDRIDLRDVEQLVDVSQTRAVGLAIQLAVERFFESGTTLREGVEAVDAFLDEKGLDVLDPFFRPGRHPGNLARPRPFEIAASVNRLRSLDIEQKR